VYPSYLNRGFRGRPILRGVNHRFVLATRSVRIIILLTLSACQPATAMQGKPASRPLIYHLMTTPLMASISNFDRNGFLK
jgi:hypothetical protein